ncbi:sirohydrochlorin chelatase [Motilimonas pumila]|uniref:Cobalamin biosynthesis protein CbiX n=1 Tax=Motilimonas pumila TaxID=2303987 RepID=A0A418YKT3_9GAMM|nr:CbiX/SirB N-terminal domain-containing protein [Motilimonas pumila]RJG51595.1 cobalamin biosynthesis protein CbiX [Motilimonas pumila]
MKALLIAAHGSRNALANEELVNMTRAMVDESMLSQYDEVKAAFLELAQPSIEIAIAELIANGCHELVVLPYFLNSGVHVKKDIPGIIEKVETAYPELNIRLLTHIGASSEMKRLISDTAR